MCFTTIGHIHIGDVIIQLIAFSILIALTILIIKFILSFFRNQKNIKSRLDKIEDQINSMNDKV